MATVLGRNVLYITFDNIDKKGKIKSLTFATLSNFWLKCAKFISGDLSCAKYCPVSTPLVMVHSPRGASNKCMRLGTDIA